MKVTLSLEFGPVPIKAKGADLPFRKTKLQLQSALCFEQVLSSRERAALLRDPGLCAFWGGLSGWLLSGDRERWPFRGPLEILQSSPSVLLTTALLGLLSSFFARAPRLWRCSPGPQQAPSPEPQEPLPLASL